MAVGEGFFVSGIIFLVAGVSLCGASASAGFTKTVINTAGSNGSSTATTAAAATQSGGSDTNTTVTSSGTSTNSTATGTATATVSATATASSSAVSTAALTAAASPDCVAQSSSVSICTTAWYRLIDKTYYDNGKTNYYLGTDSLLNNSYYPVGTFPADPDNPRDDMQWSFKKNTLNSTNIFTIMNKANAAMIYVTGTYESVEATTTASTPIELKLVKAGPGNGSSIIGTFELYNTNTNHLIYRTPAANDGLVSCYNGNTPKYTSVNSQYYIEHISGPSRASGTGTSGTSKEINAHAITLLIVGLLFLISGASLFGVGIKHRRAAKRERAGGLLGPQEGPEQIVQVPTPVGEEEEEEN